MNKKEIPTSIRSDTNKVGFGQINSDFASSKYGKKLADEIRYDRYKPKGVTNAEWENLLGVDVNNLKHLRLTYGLTRQFIRHSSDLSSSSKTEIKEIQLTLEEQENLLLAAIVHDWAEAIVGDISYDLKTLKEESVEFEELKKIAGDIYGEDNKKLLIRINYVTDTIIKDSNTKIGKIFNIIERVGYLRMALRAWQKSKEVNDNLKTNLEWMTSNVFLNQISKLIQYSETYPAVALYLEKNTKLINDAFDNLSNEAFSKYNPSEIEEKTKQFKEAHKNWQEYCGK